MNTTKIIAPDGYEIDENNSNISRIVFRKIESKLPTRWEDLELITGTYVTVNSGTEYASGHNISPENKNVFATSEQAKASLALAQLSQLMRVYNDGWEPNWTNGSEKFIIYFYSGNIKTGNMFCNSAFLAFENGIIRDKFLNNFKDLIEQAKPLL